MNRRLFVSTALAALGLGKAARAESFEFTLTDAEWRARLSPATSTQSDTSETRSCCRP